LFSVLSIKHAHTRLKKFYASNYTHKNFYRAFHCTRYLGRGTQIAKKQRDNCKFCLI